MYLLVALLAEGHVLIEDDPGVGKTALARALARSLDAEYARVQCTADLLPADVVGTNVFNQRETRFEFHPGPVFANVVLVDEINRASPKTQSGLLECMQERQVTVDGQTHELARPFMVIATQNPIEYEGTYPLPEAQLDRFMVRAGARLSRPPTTRRTMLAEHAARDRVVELEPVADVGDDPGRPGGGRRHRGCEALRRYVVALCEATRREERVELGASPRAGLMLFRASKALAALGGRDHVLPDDVQALAHSGAGRTASPDPRRRRRRSARRSSPTRWSESRPSDAVTAARATLALAVAVLLAAVVFDTTPLYVPGVALLIAYAARAALGLAARLAGPASSSGRRRGP